VTARHLGLCSTSTAIAAKHHATGLRRRITFLPSTAPRRACADPSLPDCVSGPWIPGLSEFISETVPAAHAQRGHNTQRDCVRPGAGAKARSGRSAFRIVLRCVSGGGGKNLQGGIFFQDRCPYSDPPGDLCFGVAATKIHMASLISSGKVGQ
jgi:hypothetical protein